jgi:hypothetical protein
MDPTPGEPRSHQDRPAEAGPAVEDHGRVVTANRRAAAFYRHADPTFALAIADLNAIAGTAGRLANHQQLSWERHHIEVVRSAASGDGARAAGLLREHLASVGCDPLAVHIVAQLRQPGGHDDDLEDLTCRLPGCHLARWPPIPDADREG